MQGCRSWVTFGIFVSDCFIFSLLVDTGEGFTSLDLSQSLPTLYLYLCSGRLYTLKEEGSLGPSKWKWFPLPYVCCQILQCYFLIILSSLCDHCHLQRNTLIIPFTLTSCTKFTVYKVQVYTFLLEWPNHLLCFGVNFVMSTCNYTSLAISSVFFKLSDHQFHLFTLMPLLKHYKLKDNLEM